MIDYQIHVEIWVYSTLSVIVVSLISFAGVATMLLGINRLQGFIPLLVSLAAGALLGDALIHLIPEAFDGSSSRSLTSLYILSGIVFFFIIERYLHWHHEHHSQSLGSLHPVAYLNLVSDGVHNLIDGLIIGASYLMGVPIGFATTVAVAFHEIPQELGDFGILVHAGLVPRKALLLNALSASLAFVGLVISVFLGGNVGVYTDFMLPFTAGAFVYIAGSDLIPELHHEHELLGSVAQLCMLLIGIGIMYGIFIIVG